MFGDGGRRGRPAISVNPLSALIPRGAPPPPPAPGAPPARAALTAPRPQVRTGTMTPGPALLLLLPPLLLGALPPAAAARGESWRPARRPGPRQRRPFRSRP